ncbi:uncharacterized protein [Diadema antillarum]|uniref:uncharacterized protein isoform X2 n=1 Tax=Diadema antillarum TaxID=105358 RepID=UPI003A866DFC
MEDKLGKLDLEVQDIQSVDLQIQQLKPLQREITDYRPKIVEVNKVGSALDGLLRDITQPLDTRRHYWSSQVGATLQTEWTLQKPKTKREGGRDETDRPFLEEDTEVERELDTINRRYDDLNRHLADALEDLRIVRLCADKVDSLQSMQDWVNQVEVRLTDTRPTSQELQPLMREMDLYQLLYTDIEAHQQPILQCVEDIEQFLKNQGDRIGPNKSKLLRDRQCKLREQYDTVVTQSSNRQKTLTQAIENLEKLERNLQKEVREKSTKAPKIAGLVGKGGTDSCIRTSSRKDK